MRLLIATLVPIVLAGVWNTSAEAVPGVTDDEILIGTSTDLSGPAAFLGKEISDGTRLYFRYVNDRGGVHGRRIRYIVEDDGYQPPRAVASFRKLVDRDQVFCLVGNLGSSSNLAVFPFIEREHIPLIAPVCFNSAMSTPPREYVFALDPANPDQAWIMVKYILEIAGTQAPRLAVLYQDDEFGRDGLEGIRAACAHYRLPITAEESYRRGTVDFSTQVLRLQQARPTHVLLFTLTRESAVILREAHRLDWHPQFIGASPAAEDKVIELAGAAAEGFMAVNSVDVHSDPLPPQEAFYFQVLKQYEPDRTHVGYHAFGFGIGQLVVEGLRRCGPDLSREKLITAMESFDDWHGMVGPPLSYGPGQRGGSHPAAFIVRADLETRTMIRATDWIYSDRRLGYSHSGQ